MCYAKRCGFFDLDNWQVRWGLQWYASMVQAELKLGPFQKGSSLKSAGNVGSPCPVFSRNRCRLFEYILWTLIFGHWHDCLYMIRLFFYYLAAFQRYYYEKPKVKNRRWFQIFFMFIPTWGDDPIWREYFSDGWFNHQLEKIDNRFCKTGRIVNGASRWGKKIVTKTTDQYDICLKKKWIKLFVLLNSAFVE